MAALETTAKTSTESDFAMLFANARASLPGTAWLHSLRAEALARVTRDGLPHRRLEAWKFTDFANKLESGLDLAAGTGTAPPTLFDGIKAHRIDLNGGRLTTLPAADALPDGLEIISLADALATPAIWLRQWLQPSGGALENLNLAFASGGALIRVGRNVRVDEPVILRSTLAEPGTMAHTRSVIALEEGADMILIEIDDGSADRQSFANTVTAITLEPGARLRHLRITANAKPAIVVHSDSIEVARDATYRGIVLQAAPALARQQMSARLAGTGGSFHLAAAYVAGEGEHTDLTVDITHDAPHTTSRILAKGVAAAGGHGVVQGRVIVQPDAQKTDSHQLLRALLLGAHAEIDQKPELEIYADDVKCGHGAAVGALDPNQLFYLRTRGIPEAAARNLLITAFLGEVTDRLPDPYRAPVEAWLAERMGAVA
jgi:Fe-S cluster assembly protein SufD